MALDKGLEVARSQVPECVACGYVDIETGMLLGVRTVDSHPQEVLDLVAAATADLFQGPNVTAIEEKFKQIRGVTNDDRYFQEIIVYSTNLIHVFLRARKTKSHVLVFVCRANANLGMVVVRARMALAAVEKSL